jgi:hypothetical protein
VLACYVILRPGSRLKVDRRIALASSLGAIAVVSVAAGVFMRMHGGFLRHTPKPFTPPPTAATQPSPTAAPTTAAAGGSTTSASTAPPSTVTPTTVATTTSTIP